MDLWARTSRDPLSWRGAASPISVGENSHDSQAVALPDGRFVVFYARQVGSAFDIYFRSSRDAVAWSEESRVTADEAHFDTQPHPLLRPGRDRVALAWSHQKSDEPYVDHDVWFDPDVPVGDHQVTLWRPVARAATD